ncbi:MAG: hypothetical protein QOG40_773 [Solirubrobacteraceae bacterium]|nr:hypothetical protein [Solirubrobacteraceae bacterium]
MSVLARPARGALPAWASVLARRPGRALPAWAITAAFGLVYVLVAPPSADLAAAGYRSELLAHAGFTVWDNGWYGGHHLPAYSLLAPALGALIGVQLLAALSMTLAAALFTRLLDGAFAARAARVASLWFAFGAAIGLLANRVPFDLGLAVGIGALVATRAFASSREESPGRRRWGALALVLAVLCTLGSPIAGAFLALAAVAWALAKWSSTARPDHRRFALALAGAALVPVAVLVVAFPEGGPQPFVASAFYPALAGVLLIAALMAPEQRLMRTGTLLYAIALLAAYLIPTAVGGNIDRLGALVAGPLAAACALSARSPHGRAGGAGGDGRWRVRALIAFAPLLVYWQCNAPVGNYLSAASDPAVHASFYAPLLGELRSLGVGDSPRRARIEVVPTRDHAEARWVAPHVMLARGWERQLDVNRNGLFYRAPLREDEYEDWLSYAAVAYVALPDAPLDYSGSAEGRLVRRLPPYLREVWRSRRWRLFEVLGATPLAPPPSAVTQLNSDSFTLRAPAAGTYDVRVRFTQYWALAGGHGCVRRAPGGWTYVQTRGGGSARVVIDFSLARVFDHGPRCR